jgi:DNA invertase Pin-like site-specific DNA recombinase
MRLIGYCRVSTAAQVEGLSLAAQSNRCREWCDREGHWLYDVVEEAASGKSTTRRPKLLWCLERLDAGEFDGLIVSRLDRLSRSVGDFASLIDHGQQRGWEIVCLDPVIDTSTPSGRMIANVSAAFAQFERELISQRQKESVAARKAAGIYRGGRKRQIVGRVEERIHELASEGVSPHRIAQRLEMEGFRPTSAECWDARTIKRVLARDRPSQ